MDHAPTNDEMIDDPDMYKVYEWLWRDIAQHTKFVYARGLTKLDIEASWSEMSTGTDRVSDQTNDLIALTSRLLDNYVQMN